MQRDFRPTEQGLYALSFMTQHDDAMKKSAGTGAKEPGTIMMFMFAGNVKSYTRREVKRAEAVRRLMEIIGRPSGARMRKMLANRKQRNCSLTEQDAINAYKIFGPDIGGLKGMTT